MYAGTFTDNVLLSCIRWVSPRWQALPKSSHSNPIFFGTGGAFDPGIDLLKALNLHANASNFEGVSITQGQQKKVAFKLQGTSRQLVLPFKTYEHAVELLRKNSDFTFAATLKQDERNPGTIISFSNGYNRYETTAVVILTQIPRWLVVSDYFFARSSIKIKFDISVDTNCANHPCVSPCRYLELQSSGRRNEIRIHYSYIGPKNELMVHMESFPYRLADNKWHKIALSISGTEIQLIVDCHPLYKRE